MATEASDAIGVGVRGERLVLHLARHGELVDQVNDAFRELEIPYRLKVDQVQSEAVQDALGDVAIAILSDVRTGVDVSPADVGFGLSQVLPVIVQLLGNTNSIILVEQPEIHLHPKVQSRLADVLIKSAVRGKNQVVVETHSEHILLRAQRRMRERQTAGFRAGSLGVQYVSSVEGRGVVQSLRVAADGSLLDPWPDGFFDERFEDLFATI
ncbi:AAA family ATPase [Modestobacter roseus]|uniref:AAA family ATPase n=1 Tax=Modestobacter roseus TaxID=1181884 RepID=UPI0034E017F1